MDLTNTMPAFKHPNFLTIGLLMMDLMFDVLIHPIIFLDLIVSFKDAILTDDKTAKV